jgi:hypothetical protein
MNENNLDNQAFRIVMWIFTFALVILWIGLLILPFFLPLFRKGIEAKYEKYDHRIKLIEEEMSITKSAVWVVCIIAWIITIILNIIRA